MKSKKHPETRTTCTIDSTEHNWSSAETGARRWSSSGELEYHRERPAGQKDDGLTGSTSRFLHFFFTYSQLLSSLWQSSRGCEAALTLWWSFDIFDYLKCSSLRHCYVDALHISDSQSRTRNGAEHLRPGAMVNLQSLDMSRPGCWWIWWRGWSFVLHLMLHALIWSLAEWTSSILFCCTGSGAN